MYTKNIHIYFCVHFLYTKINVANIFSGFSKSSKIQFGSRHWVSEHLVRLVWSQEMHIRYLRSSICYIPALYLSLPTTVWSFGTVELLFSLCYALTMWTKRRRITKATTAGPLLYNFYDDYGSGASFWVRDQSRTIALTLQPAITTWLALQ